MSPLGMTDEQLAEIEAAMRSLSSTRPARNRVDLEGTNQPADQMLRRLHQVTNRMKLTPKPLQPGDEFYGLVDYSIDFAWVEFDETAVGNWFLTEHPEAPE